MLVIGLMSGTSVDGIDAVLVEITGEPVAPKVELLTGKTYPYPDSLRSLILDVCTGKPLTMAQLAALDDAVAYQFSQAAIAIQSGQPAAELIGSHGQTVFHRPPYTGQAVGELDWAAAISPPEAVPLGYSLQIGRGSAIAHLTGISTVSNFRAADIASGGQGAPLVPPIDACLLGQPDRSRCVQNIGGISNVTYIPARSSEGNGPIAGVLGWDTGPGNTLLDLAVQHFSRGTLTYDHNGDWAASGIPCSTLVIEWLQQPFFQQPPPKSTGREIFGQTYLNARLRDAEPYTLTPADFLATLTELTAVSILHSYQHFLPQMPDEVLLCGGGSRNRYLKQRLQQLLDPIPVRLTDDVGLDADFKEAIAFAVLAYWRIHNYPGNLPEVTGAAEPTLLGEIHLASQKTRDRMMGVPGQGELYPVPGE